MSRFGLSCLLVLSLASTSVAFARRLVPSPLPVDAPSAPADPPLGSSSFAQPPGGGIRGPIDAQPSPNINTKVAAPSRAEVRAALLRARALNLAAFRAYYKAGIYPSNVYSPNTINVWRDEANHFCAAATIMVKGGNEALAIKLAEDNNFIKLGDVKHGEVMDWITLSGFTQAELAMIQKPFRPVADQIGDGPTRPIAINPRLRKAETARLLAKYKQVDAQLVAKQKQSLEQATNRLMKNPTLAWQLVDAMRA